MNPLYFDYNATTPVDPRVVSAMQPYLDQFFGNPSSSHAYGTETKRAVEKARKQVALLLNCRPDEIIFTSGGTESDNFALKGAAYALRQKGNHIITSSIEHPAVSEVCHYLGKNGFEITWLPVDATGRVNPGDVEKAVKPATILVSVMHANNETGVIQPIAEIGAITRARGILFHTDAAQSVGKIRVDVRELSVDLLTVAGHKLYAPKGVGALFIRRGVRLEKFIHGADHESNLRAGTENVMQIVGLGAAAAIITDLDQTPGGFERQQQEMARLRDLLHQGILTVIPEVRLNGHQGFRLPNTLSLGFPGADASLMLSGMTHVAASAGAACHSDQESVSGVLEAMKVPYKYAVGTIRFSLGRMTTLAEIEEAVPVICEAYRRAAGADPGAVMADQPQEIRLTAYTHALGCACKIRPQLLEKILKQIPGTDGERIMVGTETSDDAAVYRIDESRAVVQTVDFIPPVVDDPFSYGAIAAANAISDVYAMGARPLFALSIVCFPDRMLPLETLEQILRGANSKVAEAGIQIIGGHSIEDQEPKFGLVVTGEIDPGKILRNSTAKPGDVLILTKPVGTGIIMTALKRGLADSEAVAQAVGIMSTLNRVACETMLGFSVNAVTDVTGFGLLGHLKEMVTGASVKAIIDSEQVPVAEVAMSYAAGGIIPGGTKNNLEFIADVVHWHDGVPEMKKIVLADAQTSGGLLISLPEVHGHALVSALRAAGVNDAAIIGRITSGNPRIVVE